MENGRITDRKIVIINQAANYLTIGLANAFANRFAEVVLVTGSIHVQGEILNENIKVVYIKKWADRPLLKKAVAYILGLTQMYVLLLTRYGKHEVFFVSLPPMAYLLNIILRQRFSMLIWDVYPDAFKVTGMKEKHRLYRFWARLNKRSFNKAFRLFTISPKMADLLSQYVDRREIIVRSIWSIFQENGKVPDKDNPFIRQHQLEHKFVVQYSGNIGLAHNAEVMIALAEHLIEEEHITFQIIGRGPRVPALKRMVREKGLQNCQFLAFQSDEMFPSSLSAADVGVVVLDKMVAKGSVPSKTYNLMSFGIPGLYIAASDSELHDYTVRYRHARCFTEGELQKAADFILQLSHNEEMYEIYVKNSLLAAMDFKRSNADKLVEAYIQPESKAKPN